MLKGGEKAAGWLRTSWFEDWEGADVPRFSLLPHWVLEKPAAWKGQSVGTDNKSPKENPFFPDKGLGKRHSSNTDNF